jgi:D-arabinose 1-dehydrogenase-like Zn-dependent alcohol dehydrogenase
LSVLATKGFQPGDEVFGIGRGSFAEYACAREGKLAPKPPNLSFEQAASVAISGLPALQGLRDHWRVRPGQKVLIGGRVRPHCTLAVTVAFPVSVNVQVFVLLPPLEQAPDQMTSRLFVALSVIVVPVANDDEPLLPTATLIPAGLEVTRSPLRPVAVTVSVAACA